MNLSFLKEFDFFCGVPDSLLSPLCDYLMDSYGISDKHIITANEGNAAALAAGYHLATGKIPVVYLQNSGIGNIVNPLMSLLDREVYAIPCIFIVGWRGEPGKPDEPQHVAQGKATIQMLEDAGLHVIVVDAESSEVAFKEDLDSKRSYLAKGQSVAIVVKKGTFESVAKMKYRNDNTLLREEALECIVEASGEDVIVSTTGKLSRELFEIRERRGQSHKYDFLTVGSMGHSSSIALGIALQKPHTRVWCLDGDGAALMHMGSMAVIGSQAPKNLIHVVVNNAAHESVGGLPTVAGTVDLPAIARACGYSCAISVSAKDELAQCLPGIKACESLSFLEIKAAIGSRNDLGRPTSTPVENKQLFMDYLRS